MVRRVVLTLCILLASAVGARGEEPPVVIRHGEGPPPDMRLGPPFPANTLGIDVPPYYHPHGSPVGDALIAWCDKMVATGRRLRGTRVGGDVLYAAADALDHRVRDWDRARPLYGEAAESYPSGDPTSALALFEYGRREAWQGNIPAAARALEQLETWARASWPKTTNPQDAGRWSELAKLVDERLPLLRAQVYEAQGRFDDAGAALEALADNIDADPPARKQLWERTARLFNKAEELEAAVRAAGRVIELTPEGGDRSYWFVWRHYAEYGKLTREGAIGPTAGEATESFYDGLLRIARDRSGYGGMNTTYFAMASSAFVAGRKEMALEIYLLALQDPSFAEAAFADPSLRRGALLAVSIAAELGRFDEAELLLSILERLADKPLQDRELFLGLIARARAELEESKRTRPPAPPPPKQPEDEPRRERMGRIASGEQAPEEAIDGLPARADEGAPPWLWLAGAALVLLGFLLIRRRRG